MRVLKALVLLALLLGIPAARAADEGTGNPGIEFQGERFRPQAVQNGGRLYWGLSDPEIARFVSRTASRLQWSSSGNTLVVTGPVRETSWTPGAEQVRVQGAPAQAPGRLLGQGEGALMEPQALFFALGMVGQARSDRMVAIPLVGSPHPVAGAPERQFRIPVSTAVRCKATTRGANGMRLFFPDTAWGGGERRLRMDDVEVAVSDQQGVVMDLSFPESWHGELRPGLGLTEVLVGFRPDYAFPGQPLGLDGAAFGPDGGLDSLALQAEGPFAFSWRFDRSSRLLTLDLPGVRARGPLPQLSTAGPGLETGAFRPVGSDAEPVLRLEARLAEGAVFEFLEEESAPGKLILRAGPTGPVSPVPEVGSAATRGFAGAKGVLVLDAGHGGGDPGCVNRSLGVMEKEVTLDVALRLRDILTSQGWTVLMTREEDRDVTWAGSPDRMELQARCDVANSAQADYFISLHCNASVSSQSAGTSIHWFKQEDLDLARSLEFALGERLGLEQDGLSRDSFYVLRHTRMPAVLVEMAFLSNPREGSLLAASGFRQRVAEGLAGALASHRSGRYARSMNLPAVQSAP